MPPSNLCVCLGHEQVGFPHGPAPPTPFMPCKHVWQQTQVAWYRKALIMQNSVSDLNAASTRCVGLGHKPV
eukprot:2434448-Pleurochrysis_carterae.AAC.1